MDTRNTARRFMNPRPGLLFSGITVGVVVAVVILGIAAESQFRQPRQDGANVSAHAVSNDKSSGAARAPSETRGAAPPEIEYFPQASQQETKVADALSKTIDVDFHELPLEECLEVLAKESAISIRIDRYRGDPDSRSWFDSHTTLKLKGSSLETVLAEILRPSGFVFIFEHDALTITSSAVESDMLVTRTYPVSDLYRGREGVDVSKLPRERTFGVGKIQPPPIYADLEEALIKTIEPESWAELSGPGELCYVKDTGSLVIRQSWSVHRKVLQLLRDLRAAKRLMWISPRDRGAPAG